MRRHRFGRIAAAVAALYLAAVVAFAVLAKVTGDITLAWALVVDSSGFMVDVLKPTWWVLLLLVLVAVVQAWAYWQVLRGRVRGEPAVYGREVRLLRAALYTDAGFTLLLRLPIPYGWWMGLIFSLISLVLTWLFFRVLRDTTSTWLRVPILVTGLLVAAVSAVTYFWFEAFAQIQAVYWVQASIGPVWMVLVLVAQARDPRWNRTTVRMGVVSVVVSLVQPSSFGAFTAAGEVPWSLLVAEFSMALSVFGLVWTARSAHDLGTLQPPKPRPERVPARAWPLAVVAIGLPLVPAAVNLAHGVPFWLGPKNVLWNIVQEVAGGELLAVWYALDLLVGVGGVALLILAAAWRRTRRMLRATTLALLLLASAGFVSTFRGGSSDFLGDLPFYPAGLFVKNGSLVSAGISPLWYGLALTASALILLVMYGAPPAQRLRHHVLVAALASAVILTLVPAADQYRGPAMAAEECVMREPWEYEPEEQPRELTAEQKFVCSLREKRGPLKQFPETTPDQVVLAYGRQMCDVHTRNDPRELARLKVSHDSLSYPLTDICPSAAAVVKARKTEQDREFAEMEAESQRMCDATPIHKPRIKPAEAIRIKEPRWTDYGVLQTSEGEEWEDADLDPGNGLVSSHAGTLTVITHSDFDLCVTLETYSRRPPVETKGWDTVVEVGYDSPSGQIVLADSLSGTELPDLSLNGRKGHYRIRVHHAWFPWKGEDLGAQRLLIMAYPAPGDKEIVYRKTR